MQQNVPREELDGPSRDWQYYAVIGGAVVFTLGLMIFGPIIAGEANLSYVVLAIIVLELAIIIGGFVWLTMLAMAKSGHKKQD